MARFDPSIAFNAIDRLFGKGSYQTFQKSHACLIGLGGVGSWAAEALVRSGIGELTVIDLDDICETNINRQLHALPSTIGKSKAALIKERVLSINPTLKINAIEDFYTKANAHQLIHKEMDVIIDAIDGLSHKCHLASKSRELNIPLITCGAAAGKLDPTQVRTGDLGDSVQDMLLKRMRKKLRRDYQYESGKSEMGIRCVFSQEKAVYPSINGEVCFKKDLENDQVKNLDCTTGMGSATFLTGTFGFVAAKEALSILKKYEN